MTASANSIRFLALWGALSSGTLVHADVELHALNGTMLGSDTIGPIPTVVSARGGTAAFPSQMNGAANPGVLRYSWWGGEIVAKKGQSAGNDGTFQQFAQAATNADGDVAFVATGITGSQLGASNDTGLFLQPATAVPNTLTRRPTQLPSLVTFPIQTIAREGQRIPTIKPWSNQALSTAVFSSFSNPLVTPPDPSTLTPLSLTDDFVSFRAGVGTSSQGIFVRANGTLQTLVLTGDTITGGAKIKTINSYTPFAPSSNSWVFHATLENTLGGTNDDTGLLLTNLTNGHEVILREGTATNDGQYIDSIGTAYGTGGALACRVSTRTTAAAGSPVSSQRIYQLVANGNFYFTNVPISTGSSLPNDGGIAVSLGDQPYSNDNSVVYIATRDNAASPSGVFRQALVPTGSNGTVAVVNQPTPEGRGVFQNFYEISINRLGVVIFAADVLDQGQTVRGIYLFDGTALSLIARTGDPMMGRTLATVSFSPDSFTNEREFTMRATFTDGRSAVLLHSPRSTMLPGTSSWDQDSSWDSGTKPGRYTHITSTPNSPLMTDFNNGSARIARSLTAGAGNPPFSSEISNPYQFLILPQGLTLQPNFSLREGAGLVSSLTNKGTLEMTCNVTGGYTQESTGQLSVQLVPSQHPETSQVEVYGSLNVQGEVQIDGTLKFANIDAESRHLISPSDHFTIIRHGAGKRIGYFSNAPDGTRISAFDPYTTFVIHYTDTEVYLDQLQSTDADGDGVSDAWMKKYFTHIDPRENDRTRAADDADGDGMTNHQEFLAGTNPTNATSSLRAKATNASGTLSFTFPSKSMRRYIIESSTDLSSESWTPVHTDIIGTGNDLSYPLPDAFTEVKRFYRARVVP